MSEQRYERQIIIPGWGEKGQRAIGKARVTVVGAGGLGSTALMQLTVAGFGKIRIIDGDRVELSNLNRQVLHWERDLGSPKAESACFKLRELNPEVTIEPVVARLTDENAEAVIGETDALIDALDNFPARYVINRIAVARKIPLFHGAVWGLEGRASTIIPGEGPCLRCLYPQEPPNPGVVPVAGVTPAVIAAIQVTEAIKYFTGSGELLAGKLLVYDGTSMLFLTADITRRPDCPVCSGHQSGA